MVLILWCHIVMSDTIVAPEWHFCQTIVQYDITIVQYEVRIVAPWRRTICYNIVWSIWYFESICTITEGHVTKNWPISLEYLHLTYNNTIIWYNMIYDIWYDIYNMIYEQIRSHIIQWYNVWKCGVYVQ